VAVVWIGIRTKVSVVVTQSSFVVLVSTVASYNLNIARQID